jgi:hypothetical protein
MADRKDDYLGLLNYSITYYWTPSLVGRLADGFEEAASLG